MILIEYVGEIYIEELILKGLVRYYGEEFVRERGRSGGDWEVREGFVVWY